MPIHTCTLPRSGRGWKWGGSGKCYPSREGAERQAEAAHANGFTEDCQCDSCRSKRTKDAVTASGFFVAEQIGDKQSITPEGFLLCEDVPIARVGTQDYAYFELPELEAKDGVIVAERTADVLFAPETLASFEGKPITIDHPPDFVNPANYGSLTRGTVRNVRRGEGDQSDLMLADLLIMDAEAIRRVQSKDIIQVSNGYDADYEQIAPGRARQATITGNHVALVKNARCGPVCSIGDSKPDLLPTGDSSMAKKKPAQSTLLEKLRKAFMTRDSDAFEQAANEMTGDEGEGDDGDSHIHIHLPDSKAAGATTTDDDPPVKPEDDPDKKLSEVLTKMDARLTSLEQAVGELKSGKTADADPDADPDDETDETTDSDPDPDKSSAKTGDSTALRDEFQDALSRAEIIAPGVKLPTFDAKTARKRTADAICVLRRRALRAALDNDNAESVQAVTGGADISKLSCDAARAMFNAASELVKHQKKSALSRTTDHRPPNADSKDINQIHADFWKTRK